MKNKSRLIISLLLACVLMFGACKTENAGSSNSSGSNVEKVKVYKDGLHEYSAQLTSNWLIENRDSDYKILLPENASLEIRISSEDMQALVFEATGARLEIIEESSSGNSFEKVISIGNTKMAANANVNPTAALKDDGYMIKTVGKNVFIVANSDFAVSFGIYGFLEAQFGFECFSDEYYYINKADSVALLNLNVKEVPDLGKIQIGSGFITGKARRRMKQVEGDEVTFANSSVHTASWHIPSSKYNNPEQAPDTYHPKWFALGANQLCYTARGDAEERTAFVNEVADMVIGYIKDNPNKSFFNFGQADEFSWCTCEACREEFTKYSSNAAVVIKFLNDVAKVIDAWMSNEGKEYAREYYLNFIAYQQTLAAPNIIDESVKCSEHVIVTFCPYQLDLQNSLYAEVNSEYLKIFDAWRNVSKNFSYFGYFYFGNNFLLFYDCFEAMQEILLYLAESNTKLFYTESPPMYKGSAYHAMRTYILSKLTWNVSLDMDELIENFCKKYYMDAADIMLEIFYQERALYNMNKPLLTMRNFFASGNLQNKKYWPKNLLLDWYNLTNEALEKISYLKKTNPKLHNVIYNNITLERLSFEYGLVVFYEKELAVDFVNSLKVQAKLDATQNDVVMVSLYDKTSGLFEAWGV